MRKLVITTIILLFAAMIYLPAFSWEVLGRRNTMDGRPIIKVQCRRGGPILLFERRPNGKWCRSNYMTYFNTLEEAANYWCSRIR